jgi:hypothetical protein
MGAGGVGSEAAWEAFLASSRPILDVNEQIEWLAEDGQCERTEVHRSRMGVEPAAVGNS